MEKITKLAVFDFDGTLVNSPLPDEGRIQYEQKTGRAWPHKGWWSKPESLDGEIFEIETIDDVIADYVIERGSQDTAVIMLTGRMERLSGHVEKILKDKELEFDEYHYNRGGSTDEAKIATLERLLEKYSNVKTVTLWDDRVEHVPIFQAWGDKKVKDGSIESFKINVVPTGRH
jgi:hypothetical protein